MKTILVFSVMLVVLIGCTGTTEPKEVKIDYSSMKVWNYETVNTDGNIHKTLTADTMNIKNDGKVFLVVVAVDALLDGYEPMVDVDINDHYFVDEVTPCLFTAELSDNLIPTSELSIDLYINTARWVTTKIYVYTID